MATPPRHLWTLLVVVALLASGMHAQHPKIKHLIILMQENRSFDHLLGWLKRENVDVNGLTGDESNPVDVTDANSERVYVHDKQPTRIPVDPGHGTPATGFQIFGEWPLPYPLPPNSMQGFVEDYISIRGDPEEVMGAFHPDTIPVTYELARQFAVFDRWFCAVAGPTQPNRFFLHAATSNGMATNDVMELVIGMPATPWYDSVVRSGWTWRNYFQEVPSTLLMKWPRKPWNWSFGHYSAFLEHVRNGTLPNVSFLDPRYLDLPGAPQNDDHPGGADILNGQLLIKEIYETLRASPIWEESAFIITYDEHGGFHDHVSTPLEIPNPDNLTSEDPEYYFNRTGVRIPTIVISPWVEKGTVVHEAPDAQKPMENSEYEASSVMATFRKMWGLEGDFLTERERWASTFEHIFENRTTPRTDCPETLPDVAEPTYQSPDTPITDLQMEFVVMASSLNGGPIVTGEGWSEAEASFYIKENVCEFFGQCMYGGLDSYDGKYCHKDQSPVNLMNPNERIRR